MKLFVVGIIMHMFIMCWLALVIDRWRFILMCTTRNEYSPYPLCL